MTDFDSFGGGSSDTKGDKELQEFLLVEKQKAQFNAQVSFAEQNCFVNSCYIT